MIMNRTQSRQQCRYIQRKKTKDLQKQEKVENTFVTQIKKIFHSILMQEQLDEIARATKFITRKRELSSVAIVAVLMIGCSGSEEISSLETICSYLHKWFSIRMKPQSLQGRLNRKESAAFMKEVAIRVMKHEANNTIDKLLKKYAKRNSKHHFYKRILLQDSTVISLPESVSRIFRGCGGSASKAAIKCDVIIDQVSHLVVRIRCIAGRVPDASLSSDIIEYLREDDIVIRDLGYFNLDNFASMIKKNIKFISRLAKKVHIYLTQDQNEEPLDLVKYLETLGVSNKGIDITVYVGKIARIAMRLIGIKVPQDVLEMRRERHKKIRKSEPSDGLHEWNGYTIMVTNILKDELSLNQILKMYKTRWQIELFFKNIKSYLHIDKLTGENKYRILTLIYIKLILTWMAALLYAYAQVKVIKGREVSKFKFTKWLQEEVSWKKAFIMADFSELFDALEKDLDFLCKQLKRTRGSWIDYLTDTEDIWKVNENVIATEDVLRSGKRTRKHA